MTGVYAFARADWRSRSTGIVCGREARSLLLLLLCNYAFSLATNYGLTLTSQTS
jgi:hypothetical protein